MRLPAATFVNRGITNPYRLPGSPWRWVLHTMECPAAYDLLAPSSIVHTHRYPPHFWVSMPNRQIVQTIDTDFAAQALHRPDGSVETNHAHAIQVEIAGYATDADGWPDDWLDWLGEALIGPVARHHGVNLDHHPAFHGDGSGFVLASASSPIRFSPTGWLNFDGICGHQHVPSNDHWDPGGIDITRVIAAARPPRKDFLMALSDDQQLELLTDVRFIADALASGTREGERSPLRQQLDTIEERVSVLPKKASWFDGMAGHVKAIREKLGIPAKG